MNQTPEPSLRGLGLEPVDEAGLSDLAPGKRHFKASLRLNIRGRSVHLRGLHRPPRGALAFLAILGPGLIATSAGNDAGGIATYSQAGAQFGYSLIWVMIVITVSLAVVQEMCARLGAASGRGLLDLIRERFGLGWASFAVAIILIANGGLVISEFVGIGAAMELLGLSKYAAVPLSALGLWYLVIFANYSNVEKVFIAMTLVFFAYPIAAFLGHPHWGEVARGAFVPQVQMNLSYLVLLVGLMGTTITPYMQLFQQSSLVEKGAARRHYGPERIDAYAGSIFGNAMSIFMMIATAATLHAAGITHIDTAADAARALEPVAGHFAKSLFAIGLLGASLLAGAVLPLATSYAISEAIGTPKGVNLDFRRARVFFGLFSVLVALGAGLALVPNLPVIKLLIVIQVLNGMMLPIILIFILKLANDPRVAGELRNGKMTNILGWGTFGIVTTAVAVMLGTQLLQALGVLKGG